MPPTTTQPAKQLRLAVYQFAPRLRAVADNLACIGAAARTAHADLLLTPELSLTGYDLRDDVHSLAVPVAIGASVQDIWGRAADALGDRNVLIGAIERGDDAVPYNIGALVQHGRVMHRQRKIYLPTYGMFDEGRYFGRGRRVDVIVIDGWRMGVLICEDFWHPMLAYLHALQGAHALFVMAAAPGRGAWQGGEEDSFFASTDSWERIARTYAQLFGVYVVVCNRCGVEGGVTFAGESMVVAPDAAVIARAGVDEELLRADLDADRLAAARRPYAHVRDEDAGLALRELARVTGSG